MLYTVRVPELHYNTVVINALNAEHAVRLACEGEGDFEGSEFSHDLVDYFVYVRDENGINSEHNYYEGE